MTAYTALATREGKYWLIEVKGVGVTQARRLVDVQHMAADLVSIMKDTPVADAEVHVVPRLEPNLAKRVTAARKAAEKAARAQQDAGAMSRAVARDLLEQGLTSADAATMLGVSPQRVSQLIHS